MQEIGKRLRDDQWEKLPALCQIARASVAPVLRPATNGRAALPWIEAHAVTPGHGCARHRAQPRPMERAPAQTSMPGAQGRRWWGWFGGCEWAEVSVSFKPMQRLQAFKYPPRPTAGKCARCAASPVLADSSATRRASAAKDRLHGGPQVPRRRGAGKTPDRVAQRH